MEKPIIGITVNGSDGRLSLGFDCEMALEAAGAIPLPLPLHIDDDAAMTLLKHCDGILFSGGVDIDPEYFGEEVYPYCGDIDQLRDKAEYSFFKAARKLHMPIFGICRGHQVINVFMGGTLYQDIAAQYPGKNVLMHRLPSVYDNPIHNIIVEKGSLLEKLTHGQPMRVTSTHHQAIKDIAPGLRAGGRTSDGIIEELESTDGDYIVTVQWHPELRHQKEKHALDLFCGITEAACEYHCRKK